MPSHVEGRGRIRGVSCTYVAELLSGGILPALEERQIVEAAGRPRHELAIYHQLMSFKRPRAPRRRRPRPHGRGTLRKRADQELNTEKMLARHVHAGAVLRGRPVQLRGLGAKTGNWLLLAKALQRQADFEDERQRKYGLLEQLGVLYWKKLKDFARARLDVRPGDEARAGAP